MKKGTAEWGVSFMNVVGLHWRKTEGEVSRSHTMLSGIREEHHPLPGARVLNEKLYPFRFFKYDFVQPSNLAGAVSKSC